MERDTSLSPAPLAEGKFQGATVADLNLDDLHQARRFAAHDSNDRRVLAREVARRERRDRFVRRRSWTLTMSRAVHSRAPEKHQGCFATPSASRTSSRRRLGD